jgi:hypothetical protein
MRTGLNGARGGDSVPLADMTMERPAAPMHL